MRYLIGGSKSKKKQYHLSERRRIQRLENDLERQCMESNKNCLTPKVNILYCLNAFPKKSYFIVPLLVPSQIMQLQMLQNQ
jgi:hypothetical protein